MLFRILIWLLLVFNACSIVEEEADGNDTPLKALSAKIFTAPVTIQGSFKKTQNKGYYPIYIKKSGFYSIAVTSSKGSDIKLSLLDNNTKPLVVADDYYKNFGEQIPCLFLKKQLYYVLVESKYQKNPAPLENTNPNYTLIIQQFIFNSPEKVFSLDKENIPNIHALQSIYKDIKHFGFFQPTNDTSLQDPLLEDLVKYISHITKKDYKPYKLSVFTFNIPEKGNFLLNLTLSAVKDVDSAIVVFDTDAFYSIIRDGTIPKNAYSIIADDNGYDQKEAIEDYKIAGEKRYIVVLIGANRLNYKSFLEAQKNYYQLLFTLKHTQNDIEQEPNNSLESANILTENKISGQIESQNDTDIFLLDYNSIIQNNSKFLQTLDKNSSFLVDINLKFKLAHSLKLEILNRKNEIVKSVKNNSSDGKSISISSVLLQPNSRYFIKLSALAYSSDPIDYILNIEPRNLKQITKYMRETEPNDFVPVYHKDQKQLRILKSMKGFIENPEDQDTYFYIPAQNSKYHFELSGIPKTRLSLSLYNAQNRLIFSKTGNLNAPLDFQYNLSKGNSYKIMIKSEQKDFYDKTHNYQISISKVKPENS